MFYRYLDVPVLETGPVRTMDFVPPTSRGSFADDLTSELETIPFSELIPRLEEERVTLVPRIAEAVEAAADEFRADVQVEWADDGSLRAYLFPWHRCVTGTRALPFRPRVVHFHRDGSFELYQGTTIPVRQIAIWMSDHRSEGIDKADLKSAMLRCGYPSDKAEEWIHWAQVDQELTPVDGDTVRL